MPSPHAKIELPLIQSELVTPPTRDALISRTTEGGGDCEPVFFTAIEFDRLIKISSRLMGDPEPNPRKAGAPLKFAASQIDQRLASKKSDGWRYDALPSDGEAYKTGLQTLQHASMKQFGLPFSELDDLQIDRLLSDAESGALSADPAGFDISLWFGELLAEIVECFYSHPDALREIGYVGFADKPGWNRTGMNDLEAREKASSMEGNRL